MSTVQSSVAPLVRELYGIVRQLEALFPDRPFTLDGHLVGSLGEVLAADMYGLKLLAPGAECHDAQAPNGKLVQVKATQVRTGGLSTCPDHLIVLRLAHDGTFQEMFNGPGVLAWAATGKMQKNGHRPIVVSKLVKLMESVPPEEQLARAGAGETEVGGQK